MMRTIAFIAAAAALLFVLWWVFLTFIHTLMIVFWVAVVVLLGLALLRVGRRSSRRARARAR